MQRQYSFKMSMLQKSPRGILVTSRSLNHMGPLRRHMQRQREASDKLDELFEWERSSIDYLNYIKTEYQSTVWECSDEWAKKRRPMSIQAPRTASPHSVPTTLRKQKHQKPLVRFSDQDSSHSSVRSGSIKSNHQKPQPPRPHS